MEFKDVIQNRYSCKDFSTQQIEKEKLTEILEAGRVAPTAKNLQEQKIYVVQSKEYLDKIYGVEINIRNILSSVLLEIIIENREKLIEKKTYKNLDNQRIKGMLDFIQKNYSNELTLKEIGEAVFIGERETLRCFARTIGISPIEYLKKYRVKVAANLLTTTDLPVTEICIQCGFNSPSYFSKSFQRVFNVTPREYRKNKIVTM